MKHPLKRSKTKVLKILAIVIIMVTESSSKTIKTTRHNLSLGRSLQSFWVDNAILCYRACESKISHLGSTVGKFIPSSGGCNCCFEEIITFDESTETKLKDSVFTYEQTQPGNEVTSEKDGHFEQDCPCLESYGSHFYVTFARDASHCAKLCLFDAGCYAVNFDGEFLTCEFYSKFTVAFNEQTIKSQCCIASSDSSRKFYMVRTVSDGFTEDCASVKKSGVNPSEVTSGNYTIKIRGFRVDVYCDMDSKPPKTYMTAKGVSYYGGHYSKSPKQPFTTTWHKVRLIIDGCYLAIDVLDRTFASSSEVYSGPNMARSYTTALGFGKGTTCVAERGRAEVDLSMTPFFIQNSLDVEGQGIQVATYNKYFDSGRQGFSLEVTGRCGSIHLVDQRNRMIYNNIPIMLKY